MANSSANSDKGLVAWALIRISLGLIFLWAFFDKLFGLGFTTCRDAKTGAVATMCDAAWVNGGSPTTGFLKFASSGPFESFYKGLAGNTLVDWLFMLGLALIGVALITGIATKLATLSGMLLMMMMWSAVLPPEHHPFLDDHVVYTIALFGIYSTRNQQKWSLRNWWVKQPVVKQLPLLH